MKIDKNLIKTELFENLFNYIYINVFANIVLSTFWLYFFKDFTKNEIITWYFTLNSVLIFGLILKKLYDRGVISRNIAYLSYLIAVLLVATLWAIITWHIYFLVPYEYKFFIGFFFAGFTAGAVATLSFDFILIFIFLTITVGNIIYLYITDSNKIIVNMAFLSFIYYIFLIFISYILRKNIKKFLILKRKYQNISKRYKKIAAQLQLILDHVPVGIFFYDKEIKILEINNAITQIFETTKNKILSSFDINKIKDKLVKKALYLPIKKGESGFHEGEYKSYLNDKKNYIRLKTKPVYDNDKNLIGALGIIEDIKKEKENLKKIEKFAQFYIKNPNPVFQYDCSKKIILTENRAGKTLRNRFFNINKKEWKKLLLSACKKESKSLKIKINNKHYQFDIVHIKDNIINIYGKDITQEEIAKEKIDFLAYYDELTHLPKRELFFQHLKKSISELQRTKCFSALLFLDLDNFKYINDTFGHDIGDKLLIELSKRLKYSIRSTDVISRFGGDEFVILLNRLGKDEIKANETVKKIATKILKKIREPFKIENKKLNFSISIGIVLFNSDKEPYELLKSADLAMYEAKIDGKNSFKIFDKNMQLKTSKKNLLLHDIYKAIEESELLLFYQPIIDLKNNSCRAAEVLLKWKHSSFGLLNPLEFIPIAESNYIIHKIGLWVLKNSYKDFKELSKYLKFISVNVSTKEFMRDDYLKEIENFIKEGIIEPKYIELELTESVILKDFEKANEKLKKLKEYGFKISLDDFGTGYSSLSYLKNLSIENLKIDQSFISDINLDNKNRFLTQTIINLSHHLGMKTIAEGIENEEQLNILRSLNCDYGQGYYFVKPMEFNEFKKWLENWK